MPFRTIAAFLCAGAVLLAADPSTTPVVSAWIRSTAGTGSSRPDVHSVEVLPNEVVVRSAGISLGYLGALQSPPFPIENARQFEFHIPRNPRPATGRHTRIPLGYSGVFLNGVPIYNQFETLSYNGADLWHYDAVARANDGTHSTSGLLEQLIVAGSQHSPLIGFALDGYPVYGPWGFANPDGTGGLRRMRSSYVVRTITRRHILPDGAELMPVQYGPNVTSEDPLGTFAEDYQYSPGSGDLDEFNGRFTVTPEFPTGTYAYFLSTYELGRQAFPYLIGPRFYGQIARPLPTPFSEVGKSRITLTASSERPSAGQTLIIRLEADDAHGEPIRHFENVHERPIHLLIASANLAEFDHIHPQLTDGDLYEVPYTFRHGGQYRVWADYSLPGEPPRVDRFDVTVAGENHPPQRLTPSALTQSIGPLTVTLAPSKPLHAQEDITIRLQLGGALDRLEPYLGAWTHVIIVSEDSQVFSHAHPVEAVNFTSSTHTHIAPGPPPRELEIATSFPTAGLYKLWAQFQVAGEVLTVPFVVKVEPALSIATEIVPVPADAIRIRLSQSGYDPARLSIPADRPVTLAFTRDSAAGCGSEVVFPTLHIRTALPPGQTILVKLPPQPAGEIAFACGMGMYRGMIVAR